MCKTYVDRSIKMNDYLKSYKACINVHSPLYIGSGQEYTKKEYIFENNTVSIVDLKKLSDLIYKKNLFTRFSDFMTGNEKDLYKWLQSCFSQREIDSIIHYFFSTSNVNFRKQEIKTCIKDPFCHPYIPGSSIKGYIRTALLALEISRHPKDYSEFKNKFISCNKKELEKLTSDIEKTAFGSFSESKMSGIIVSDSKPVSTDNLVLCEKIDLHSNGKESVPNTYYEAIKPGTKNWFTITIDSTKCDYTKDDIMNAIKLFAKQYKENYLFKFKEIELNKYVNTIWLGGNTGYPTKTIAYNLFGKDTGVGQVCKILGNSFQNNKNDNSCAVSPHCLNATNYNGKLYNMGECTLAFAKSE